MDTNNKNYWFSFEPYVFITLKEKAALLYNTLDGKHIRVTDNDALTFIKRNLDKNNHGVVKVSSAEWNSKAVVDLIHEVREKYFGDLYDRSFSKRKPIQFYPNLYLQDEVNKMKKFDPKITGRKIFSYLYQVLIDCESLSDKPLDKLVKDVWFQVRSSELKKFSVKIHTLKQFQQLQKLCAENEELRSIWEWHINDANLFTELPEMERRTVLTIHHITKVDEKVFKSINPNVIIHFKIHNEEEFKIVSNLIDTFKVARYHIEPEYNKENIHFFEEYVYLTQKDLFSSPISMQEIMRNQVLNSQDFGKLYINASRDVYANPLLPKISNLKENSIREIIHHEMTNGKSWLRVRNKKPCNDCIYQWLCPSPSNYEILIGKNDLCKFANE